MGLLNVLAAGIGAFVFGAIWYMTLAERWKAASGVALDESGNPVNQKDPLPYITSFVSAILVAGMMRHVFVLSDIDTVGKGLLSGFGIGFFLVTPWIATFYGFSGKPRELLLIDGGYASFGCAVIGAILTLF